MKSNFISFSVLLATALAVSFSGGSALAQTGVITDVPLDPTLPVNVLQGGSTTNTNDTPAAPQKSACPPRHARVKISFELDGAEIAAAACVSREQDPEFLLKTLDVLSTLGKMEFLEAVDAAQPKK